MGYQAVNLMDIEEKNAYLRLYYNYRRPVWKDSKEVCEDWEDS